MSSRLWAVNATKKKKNELVPGSSRWITNEMSLQYDSALTNCEDHFQDCSSRYDSLSSFVQKVLDITNSTEDHTEDLSLLLAVSNPTVFSPEFSKSTTFVQPTEPEDMYSSNHKDSTPNIRTANSNDITIPVKPENIKEDTVISESRNSLKQAIIAQSSPIRHRTSQYRQTPVKPRINQPPRLMHASPNQIDISPPHLNSSMDRIDTRKSLSSSSPPKVVQQSLPSVETHQTEHTSTARNTSLINGIDDSFQAISTAIRKSIAGKSALTISSSTPAKAKKSGVYEEFETKINLQPEEANRSSTIHSTASSNENTRKISASMRSSIFVGLPTREPITVNTKSSKHSSIKSRSSRLFERLDIASRRDTSSEIAIDNKVANKSEDKADKEHDVDANFDMSPVAIPKRAFANFSSIKSQVDMKNNGTTNLNSVPDLSNTTSKSNLLPDKPVRIPNKEHTIPSRAETEENIISEISVPSTKAPREPEDVKSTSATVRKTLLSESPSIRPFNSSTNGSRSPTRSYLSFKYKGSPREPTTRSRSRSPTRSVGPLSKKSSPISKIHDTTGYDVPENDEKELISRLTIPTSSSAAKRKTPTSSKRETESRKSEGRKTDLMNTKNRFLTTTLNSNNPQFSLKRPQFQGNQSVAAKPLHSPTRRRNPAIEDLEIKTAPKLEPDAIPILKKKSMMAERSEAAAQKPKQKFTISMNHTSKHKAEIVPFSNQKQLGDVFVRDEDTKESHDVHQFEKYSYRNNAVALPEAARGGFGSAKRRKTNKEDKTPSRTGALAKKQFLEKKASRISVAERRTPHKNADPLTPAKLHYSAENLPDIPTDDEDDSNGKDRKILQTWGHTPEIKSIIMKNIEVNPVSVFGDVPQLNMEEIFDSHSSRARAMQSPDMSPLNLLQRQKEEREYASYMGYKS
ncbi:hypothetical protein G9P44_004398 [Scheffersomyces stipitis]|nr:hypothetical protein G9P44_004398 [Scheffersomyces stipitis]